MMVIWNYSCLGFLLIRSSGGGAWRGHCIKNLVHLGNDCRLLSGCSLWFSILLTQLRNLWFFFFKLSPVLVLCFYGWLGSGRALLFFPSAVITQVRPNVNDRSLEPGWNSAVFKPHSPSPCVAILTPPQDSGHRRKQRIALCAGVGARSCLDSCGE